MNHKQIESTKMIINDMRHRIQTLQLTIVKMEESGKFDPDDPRFERMQEQIFHMERMMTNLAILIGDRPYKLEHPSLDEPKNLKGIE